MDSKVLNFPDAMYISDLLMKYSGNYIPSDNPQDYILSAFSEFTDEEIEWVRRTFSPTSWHPMGQLDEICKGIYDNNLLSLCLAKEEKC